MTLSRSPVSCARIEQKLHASYQNLKLIIRHWRQLFALTPSKVKLLIVDGVNLYFIWLDTLTLTEVNCITNGRPKPSMIFMLTNDQGTYDAIRLPYTLSGAHNGKMLKVWLGPF